MLKQKAVATFFEYHSTVWNSVFLVPGHHSGAIILLTEVVSYMDNIIRLQLLVPVKYTHIKNAYWNIP